MHDEVENMLTVFALNTDKNNRRELLLDVRSFGKIRFVEHKALFGENLFMANSPEQPDAVYPVNLEIDKTSSNAHTVMLEKASWNVMRFDLTGKS